MYFIMEVPNKVELETQNVLRGHAAVVCICKWSYINTILIVIWTSIKYMFI